MDQSIPISTAALTNPPPSIQDFPLMQQAKLNLNDNDQETQQQETTSQDAKLQLGE